jgi:hypothetical protein
VHTKCLFRAQPALALSLVVHAEGRSFAETALLPPGAMLALTLGIGNLVQFEEDVGDLDVFDGSGGDIKQHIVGDLLCSWHSC